VVALRNRFCGSESLAREIPIQEEGFTLHHYDHLLSQLKALTLAVGLSLIAVQGRGESDSNGSDQPKSSFRIPDVNLQVLPRIFPDEAVVDKRIVSGKKITTLEKSELPPVPSNQFRQMLAEVPGLIISEVNNESWASLTYRGLGDPHESVQILNLRDGLPSTPDPYGYPAGYYSPPFEALERVEFIRGGAGLLYGPQPGGALNFILRKAPRGEELKQARTTNLGGSFGRYSTSNEFTQGNENWGQLLSLHARGIEGFREANNFSKVLNPRWNLRYSSSPTSHILFDFDLYQGRFGEPGGLAKMAAANVLTLDDPRRVTLRNDQIEIDRTGLSLGWDKAWSADLSTLVEVWNSNFRRSSFRQSLGGSPGFGGIAQGTTNVIQDQRFQTTGLQGRLQRDTLWGDQRQTLTAQVQVIQTLSPFQQEAGSTPTARRGAATRKLHRQTDSQALVLESAIPRGPWTLTPGLRLEQISQKIKERLNTLGSVPLRQETKNVSVMLGGLGLEYKNFDSATVYANFSQGYKPPAFQDSVPLGTADTISEDLKEARVLNHEMGVRGSWTRAEYDLSIFRIDYSNIFGRVGSQFQNVGRSRSEGLEALVAYSLSRQWRGFVSAAWMNSRFVGGPLKGNRTQYSPDSVYRAGLTYSYGDLSFVRFQGQWVSKSFGDDGNSENFRLNSMSVFDVTGQHRLGRLEKSEILLNWGVQNLTDQKTPTRVRSNGYEPASPRALFGGFTFVF
jgi:Fe(3+) dicitrate transport protein